MDIEKPIFPPEWNDEKLYLMLKNVVKKSAEEYCEDKYYELEDYYGEKEHKFILPPIFRNGCVKIINKLFVDNNWNSLNSSKDDVDEIFIMPDIIKSAIWLLFDDQNGKDDSYNNYKIDDANFCKLVSNCCTSCKRSIENSTLLDMVLYSCCDQVYPLQKSWFDVQKLYCSDCRFFFLENEEEILTILLTNILPKDLVAIVKTYLPLRRSALTMRKVSPLFSEEEGQKKMVVKMETSSSLTEWFPFFGYVENELVTLFVNCNPDSKFYSTIFYIDNLR